MPKLPSKTKPRKSDVGVIYARYSSHAQKDASIEQQVAECMKYAKQIGLSIVESYEDRAITGKTDKRPSFQQMMKDAAKGMFQYVLSWKSNRIGRNMLEAMQNELKLQDLGIRVMYVEEDFDDTAAGRFALRSMMNVNQFYSENMAEDVRRGMYANANECKVTNGNLPFGYKANTDLKYILDEPKDAIVREIYSRVACGEPYVDIAADLNRRGIKTARGKEWGKHSFHALLSNERYRGIYIYGDVRIEGGIPRIVSDELFFKVQELLKMKKNARGRHSSYGDYLLTGKLFCGKCKSPMSGISGTSKTGDLHYYYTCQKRRIEHKCDKANVRRDSIEYAVGQAIKDYIRDDKVVEWLADMTIEHFKKKEEEAHIGILKDQLAETQKAIKNIMTAIEHGIITDTTKSRLLELETEQASINAKIAVARADIIPVNKNDLISMITLFRDYDVNDKRSLAKLFDAFLVAVYLYDDNMKIVFCFSGNNNTVTVPFDIDTLNSNEAESSFKVPLGAPVIKDTA